jgi:hypothetical protein
MNYQAFTDDALLLMHYAAVGALAVDDELEKLGHDQRFRIRETPDWIEHSAELEAEMRRRGMSFDAIKWSDDEASASHLADAPQLPGPEPNDSRSLGEGQSVENAALRNRISILLRRRFRIVSNDDVLS